MPPPPPTSVTAGENADALMRSLRSSIRIQEPREGGRDGAQEPGSVQCSMCLARSWVPESETVKLVLLLVLLLSLDS